MEDYETTEAVPQLTRTDLMQRHARLARARELLSRGLDMAMSALEDTDLIEGALETWLTDIAMGLGDLEDEEPRHTIQDDLRALQALAIAAEDTPADPDAAAIGECQEPDAEAADLPAVSVPDEDESVPDCSQVEQCES